MSMAESGIKGFEEVCLPQGWGRATLDRFSRTGYLTRSLDSIGRYLHWNESPSFSKVLACDLEHVSRDVREMSRLFDIANENFLISWTCTEVVAKLLDEPVLMFAKSYGLIQPDEPLSEDWSYLAYQSQRGDSIQLICKFSSFLESFMAFGQLG